MAKIDFISILDHTRDDLDEMLAKGAKLKKEWKAGTRQDQLGGKTLGVIFHKPSLRTRLSFEAGMGHLGGRSLYITDAEIGFGKREAIKDIGNVMSRFLDGIMIRTFDHNNVVDLASHSQIPIINGLTDWVHPCQIMADMLTLQEKGVPADGMKLSYIGDGNNVTNSWIHAAYHYEIDLRIVCPDGFEPDMNSVKKINDEGKGKVTIVRDPVEGVSGAQVLYADTWTSMGQEEESAKRREIFSPYQLNDELLKQAEPGALVMHCLPAHRNEEITDSVIDGPQSIVYDQAENRMHGQKGILLHCLGNE
jgi:ornithine carbamoyltransferase